MIHAAQDEVREHKAPAELEAFIGHVITDLGAAFSGVLVNVGRKLGLYAALADHGSCSPAELAEATDIRERYVREWLNNQTAGGYLSYDPGSGRYSMSEAQALVLARESSSVYMAPAFEVAASFWLDEDKIVEAFRSGRGLGWHEHHHRLFCGTEMFFRTGYRAHLVGSWLPALNGVVERLQRGARVADIGCGHGVSTLLMAEAFPSSTIIGIDYHAESIRAAERKARDQGLTRNASFKVATATDYEDRGFDLICFMDCLHDLGDPIGALVHARQALNPGGTVMLVEPLAGDGPHENLHPVGRLFYAASSMACTPNALSQDVGLALGAQAGEKRLREIAERAGFRRTRRAAETPVNLILELTVD